MLEVVLGIGVGLALGLTGGGGGVLAFPALTLVLGYSISQAIPISLIAVTASALLGCIDGFSRGLVRYKAASLMALAGIILSPIGIGLSQYLPEHLLKLLFGFLMLFVSSKMVISVLEENGTSEHTAECLGKDCIVNPKTGRFIWSRQCFTSLSALGGLTGMLSGMLGVGGGFLIVPGIRQYSNLTMHGIVATSLTVITLVSGVTVIFGLGAGVYEIPNGIDFILSCIGGMTFGRFLAPYCSGKALTVSFSILAFLVAISLMGTSVYHLM